MDYEELNNTPPYSPVNEFHSSEQEFDISSYFTDETNGDNLSSFSNKKRKRTNNKNENGSYIFKRTYNGLHVKIQCFATKSTMGTKIKSATLGTYYDNMYVGKKDEDMLFKVRVVNGETGNSAYGNDFYYDSPEEYERHLFVKLPQKIKDKWMEKYLVAKLVRNIINKNKKEDGIHESVVVK
jgi:hypothetical protein